ncbi:hypothetical protein [Serratia sp. 509]
MQNSQATGREGQLVGAIFAGGSWMVGIVSSRHHGGYRSMVEWSGRCAGF